MLNLPSKGGEIPVSKREEGLHCCQTPPSLLFAVALVLFLWYDIGGTDGLFYFDLEEFA